MGKPASLISGNGERPVLAWEPVRQTIALAFVLTSCESKVGLSIGCEAIVPCNTKMEDRASNEGSIEGLDANNSGAFKVQAGEKGDGRTVQLSSQRVMKESEPPHECEDTSWL